MEDDIKSIFKKPFVDKLEAAIREAEQDNYQNIRTLNDLIKLLKNRNLTPAPQGVVNTERRKQ